MAKYINAEKLKESIRFEMMNLTIAQQKGCLYAIQAVDHAPTADVQEVTRCKDCVFATYIHDNQTNKFTIFRCEQTRKLLDDENSFCSWAKKKAQWKEGEDNETRTDL